jgi:hypothetical protein
MHHLIRGISMKGFTELSDEEYRFGCKLFVKHFAHFSEIVNFLRREMERKKLL